MSIILWVYLKWLTHAFFVSSKVAEISKTSSVVFLYNAWPSGPSKRRPWGLDTNWFTSAYEYATRKIYYFWMIKNILIFSNKIGLGGKPNEITIITLSSTVLWSDKLLTSSNSRSVYHIWLPSSRINNVWFRPAFKTWIHWLYVYDMIIVIYAVNYFNIVIYIYIYIYICHIYMNTW